MNNCDYNVFCCCGSFFCVTCLSHAIVQDSCTPLGLRKEANTEVIMSAVPQMTTYYSLQK